jgi:lysophospholipase L1-like esterase
MSKTLAIVCIALVLLNCSKKDVVIPPVVTPPPVVVVPPVVITPAKKYLALGDSYTIGQSVPEADRFPVQTKKWLVDSAVNMIAPEIIAATGWPTTSLQAAIASQNPQGPYDVVSLLIGVNDQYQQHDTTGYRARFLQLLNTSIQLAGNRSNRVFVVSIPDYSVTPFAQFSDTSFIRQQIDQFNAINREVTTQKNCNYLDITPSTREAKNDPSLLAADGLHPSGKEYKKWAERLGPMMKAVLQ